MPSGPPLIASEFVWTSSLWLGGNFTLFAMKLMWYLRGPWHLGLLGSYCGFTVCWWTPSRKWTETLWCVESSFTPVWRVGCLCSPVWGEDEGKTGCLGGQRDYRANHGSGSPEKMVKIQVLRHSAEVEVEWGRAGLGTSMLRGCLMSRHNNTESNTQKRASGSGTAETFS